MKIDPGGLIIHALQAFAPTPAGTAERAAYTDGRPLARRLPRRKP